jgi:hypothetical protein
VNARGRPLLLARDSGLHAACWFIREAVEGVAHGRDVRNPNHGTPQEALR